MTRLYWPIDLLLATGKEDQTGLFALYACYDLGIKVFGFLDFYYWANLR